MNRDISYIHSNKLATPNKLYYGKDGVYIGLSTGRLKKLDKNSFSYFNKNNNKDLSTSSLLQNVTFETEIDLGEDPVFEKEVIFSANVTESNKVFVQEIYGEEGDPLIFKSKCYNGYVLLTVTSLSFIKGIKKIQYIVI